MWPVPWGEGGAWETSFWNRVNDALMPVVDGINVVHLHLQVQRRLQTKKSIFYFKAARYTPMIYKKMFVFFYSADSENIYYLCFSLGSCWPTLKIMGRAFVPNRFFR